MEKVIFFGNGPLADYALQTISKHCEIVFHAKTREDLERVRELKQKSPELHGILASFGVIIKPDLLELFEPEGILNIHPSLLPLYRGASPIESAILAGDTDFSVSVMKLVKEMDAGPVYYQTTLKNLPLKKDAIYETLAAAGAEWVVYNLVNLPKPTPQDDTKATFCGKLEKSDGILTPKTDTAETIYRKIVAFQGFPKAKFTFFGINCIIIEAHLLRQNEEKILAIPCLDGRFVAIDKLQPEGRKVMDAKSFLNGYRR